MNDKDVSRTFSEGDIIVNATVDTYVGGFIGYVNKAEIMHSYSTGNLVSSGTVCGFVGDILNIDAKKYLKCFAAPILYEGKIVGFFGPKSNDVIGSIDSYYLSCDEESDLNMGIESQSLSLIKNTVSKVWDSEVWNFETEYPTLRIYE